MECNFGYPNECTSCKSKNSGLKLSVRPHYQNGSGPRVMLIGQDPTISKDPSRVKEVLMLDEENGQLSRWLKKLFGEENFANLELYATNLVKCTFPNSHADLDIKYLSDFFSNCKSYLIDEIKQFRPDAVFTFGEPAHYFFSSLFDEKDIIPSEMKKAFTGEFYKVSIQSISFDYSPCLHIKTFRVAETYGDNVKLFKTAVQDYFK